MKTLPLKAVLLRYRPGSHDPPWTWDDEEREVLNLACPAQIHEIPGITCDDPEPGCYQRKLETHIAQVGIEGGIVLGDDGRIWDGHHRLIAAKRLGIHEIPIIQFQESK